MIRFEITTIDGVETVKVECDVNGVTSTTEGEVKPGGLPTVKVEDGDLYVNYD